MVKDLVGYWLLGTALVVAVDVRVADAVKSTLALYSLAVPFRLPLPLSVLIVAEALSIVGAPEVAVAVVRPQVDVVEVLAGPKGVGLLHTGARSLLVQFCRQPQSARGGSGFESVQQVWVKETAFQFLWGEKSAISSRVMFISCFLQILLWKTVGKKHNGKLTSRR